MTLEQAICAIAGLADNPDTKMTIKPTRIFIVRPLPGKTLKETAEIARRIERKARNKFL